MSTAKLILLPIEWKENKEIGTLDGHIGVFLVGRIRNEYNSFHVIVVKNEIQLKGCVIEYTSKTAESTLQQAKDYVKNKITEQIISEHNTLISFIDNQDLENE